MIKINKYFLNNKNVKSVFNFPKSTKSNFQFKKRNKKNLWPTIFPTSCISTRRNNFKKFTKFIKPKNFPSLEVDARFVIFSKFYNKEYKLIMDQLTTYNTDYYGITSKIKKFSKRWWLRRDQAYEYLKYILKYKNEKLGITLDSIVTRLFIKSIKFIK